MAEDKKRKTTRKKVATSKRKKPAVKKTPMSKRRSSVAKKAPVKRPVTRKRKPKSDDEILIPIHTVDVSKDAPRRRINKEKPAASSGSSHQHDRDADELKGVSDYTIDSHQKSVEGLVKREGHEIPKDDVITEKPRRKKGARKGGKIALIILGVLLGIAAIVAVVFTILTSRQATFTGDAGIFSATGPSVVQSGNEVVYSLALQNNEQVGFENVVFDIIYPEGFQTVDVNPKAANFNQTKWELGSVHPGNSTEVQITGILIGAQNEDKELSARVSYRPENVSTEFSEEKIVITQVDALDTEFSISGAESVTASEEFEMEIIVENTIGVDLEDLRVKMEYPDGFEYKSSKPRPDFGTDSFDISLLKEGDSEIIKIKGIVSGKTNEKILINAHLGFATEGNEFVSQIEVAHKVIISEVIATIETKVFDQKESALSLGEKAEFKISYKNEGTEAFKNVRIETKVDTTYIDVSTVDVDRGKFEDSVIVWNSETIEDFETVNPGDEGELTFSVKLVDQISINNKEDKNMTIEAVTTFSSDGVEGNEDKKVSIESNTATININSELDIDVEAHYYDFEGNKVGSGPSPPVKNTETKYRVYLIASNTLNEVNDVVVTLKANDSVSFTGKKSTEVGTIEVNGKNAVWTIGKVPAHTGRFSKNIEAYIDISFTPTASEVGTAPDLFSLLSISGNDAYTSQELTPDIASPTSLLKDDPFSNEGGEVLAEESTSTDSSIISPDNIEAEPFVTPDSATESEALR